MKASKGTFNVLASIEKHIQALKPLLPKQAIVCIGEYSIKLLLKEPGLTKAEGALPILIEKSSDEVYKWLPRGFNPHFILGFEDAKIKMHFYYNVLPHISKDESVLESLKKKSLDRLHGALICSSVWDGVGSACLPTLISKFKASNIEALSLALMPSKLQSGDAHFNCYASLQMCLGTDGATVVLMDRDDLESYEGVDRDGEPIKGNEITNYLVGLFLAKDTLIDEIAELSRTFSSKLFTALLVTGASYKIYGSLDNMLNTALLKPLLTFDLSSTAVLYVLLRMPLSLKDTLPRGKIELAIANWFKDKANLKSMYITEPVYTDDMSDRVDIALLVGGFDTAEMFNALDNKVKSLRNQAIEKGLITQDWQVIAETEPPKEPEAPATANEPPAPVEPAPIIEEPKIEPSPPVAEEPKIEPEPTIVSEPSVSSAEATVGIQNIEEALINPAIPKEKPQKAVKPKRERKTSTKFSVKKVNKRKQKEKTAT